MMRFLFSTYRGWLLTTLSFLLVTVATVSINAQETLRTYIYDAATGNFSLEVDGLPLSTLQIESKSGVFTGDKPAFLTQAGLLEPNRLIDLRSPIPDTNYGPAMTPGLSLDLLSTDLTFTQFPAGNVLLAAKDYTPRVLRYDTNSGALSLDAPIGIAGESKLTSLVINSESGIFTGNRPSTLTNTFDVFRKNRIFKLDVGGFDSVPLDTPTIAGWTEEDIANDLCIAGSLVGGGSLVGVRLNAANGPLVSLCETIPDFGGPIPVPSNIRFDYEITTGRLIMSVTGAPLSALELKTPLHLFTGTRPSQLTGLFDVFTPEKLFILKPGGFESTDFGPVLPPRLTMEQLSSIQINGALQPGGSLGNVSIGYLLIPEPTGSPLLSVCWLAAMMRRRRSTGALFAAMR